MDIPIGKFTISRSVLNSIAYACQDREFADEVDKLEKFGGDSWIEVIYNCFILSIIFELIFKNGLKTSLLNGITADKDDLE